MACIRIECKVAIPGGYKIVLGKQKTVRRLSRRQGSSQAFGEPLTCVTKAENSKTLKDSSIRLTGVAWGLHHRYDQQRVESWYTDPSFSDPNVNGAWVSLCRNWTTDNCFFRGELGGLVVQMYSLAVLESLL